MSTWESHSNASLRALGDLGDALQGLADRHMVSAEHPALDLERLFEQGRCLVHIVARNQHDGEVASGDGKLGRFLFPGEALD